MLHTPWGRSETSALALKAAGARALDGVSQDQLWKMDGGQLLSPSEERTPPPQAAHKPPGTSASGPRDSQGLGLPTNTRSQSMMGQNLIPVKRPMFV